jgi:TPR repeat protein
MNHLAALLADSGDPVQARQWWQRAAKAGDTDAMYNLGILLSDSDPVQARRWYQRAAEAGVPRP